ncbi:hypothetical protein IPJ72_04390 [Candidatus Peregrinibacteria bacterium]|nr:MAG: hypothetical protein IPJ72_04390 [Candidatus Peregrinibacteria bacterium]
MPLPANLSENRSFSAYCSELGLSVDQLYQVDGGPDGMEKVLQALKHFNRWGLERLVVNFASIGDIEAFIAGMHENGYGISQLPFIYTTSYGYDQHPAVIEHIQSVPNNAFYEQKKGIKYIVFAAILEKTTHRNNRAHRSALKKMQSGLARLKSGKVPLNAAGRKETWFRYEPSGLDKLRIEAARQKGLRVLNGG